MTEGALISSSVRDLAAGSGLRFEDRAEQGAMMNAVGESFQDDRGRFLI